MAMKKTAPAKGKMPAFMMAKYEKSGADKKADAKGIAKMAPKRK